MDGIVVGGRWWPGPGTALAVARAVGLAILVVGCQTSPQASDSSGPPATTGAEATPGPGDSGDPEETTVPVGTIPPALPEPDPTSPELIRAALAAGRIDEPTALLYRVYAMFADSRLPAEYMTATWHEDGAAIAQAVFELDTLPPETAAELRPFLARPTDPESVFFVDSASAAGALAPVDRDLGANRAAIPAVTVATTASGFVCEADGWGHIDGGTLLNGPAWKVWATCNDPQALSQATTVAGMMESLYLPEVRLMGPPIPDRGGPKEAGDGSLDVYLVNQCIARSGRCLGDIFPPADAGAIAYASPAPPHPGPAGAKKSSGYVVFKRSFMGANTEGSLAHELFHVLQFAHNSEGVLQGGEWSWFVEASAKWGESWFHAAGRPVGVYPWVGIFQATPYGLNDTAAQNEYASFMWPLFMQQEKTEQSIGKAWQAIEGRRGWTAVNAAIDAQLSFTSRFRDFAVRAWNAPLSPASPDPLAPRFQVADRGLPQTGPARPRFSVWDTLQGKPRGTPPRKMPETIPSLGARYTRFETEKSVHQIVVDFSHLDPVNQVDVDALLRIKDKGWERRKLTTGETRFCLDNEDDDIISLIIVLSNHDPDIDDTVAGYWTIEALEEPCVGWDVQIEWTDVYDGVFDTITFKGLVDTIEQGQGNDVVYMTGVGTATGSRAGWKACNPGIPDTPNGSGPAEFQAIVIDDAVTFAAFASINNVLAGISTGYFEVPVDGGTAKVEPTTPVGDLCPHYSFGSITVTALQKQGP